MSKKDKNTGLYWQYFPKNKKIPEHLLDVINVFNDNIEKFDSINFTLKSDDVLKELSNGLEKLNYFVEKSKNSIDKITVPVLFGTNGVPEKNFEVDAYSSKLKTVIEVEAGQATINYHFLKDLFESCVMSDVDYTIIAVRKIYVYKGGKSLDFDKVCNFMETLYSSDRLTLPLQGILIIGY